MVLISVIIPCYNNSSTIKRALVSVINQTYKNIEIIVIDDASSKAEIEDIEKIINNLNDDRITLIKHERNKNGSAARNTGIKNSKGEYLAFLDADDEWKEELLEIYINQKNNENKLEINYCKELIINNSFQNIIVPNRGINKNEDLSEYLLCEKGFIQTSSLFLHKSVLNSYNFNENLIRYQDYDLIMNLAYLGFKFKMINYLGVILHWEETDQELKGATRQYSLNWATNNKKLFTKKSLSCFLLKRVVYSYFKKKKRLKGLLFFIKNCRFKMPIKEYMFFISFLFFGRIVFSKIKK